jgi:outer membrane biosynthesis protein TonB
VRRSGNGSVDDSALRAIQRASPFPVPPEELKWEALNEGFLVEFDPREPADKFVMF